MNIALYINSKKIRFFNIGWFEGEEFSLFKLNLFNKTQILLGKLWI